MDWSFPPEAEEFRNEVKRFIAEHLTEDVISSTHDGTIHNWEFHQKIAERGWLGLSLIHISSPRDKHRSRMPSSA